MHKTIEGVKKNINLDIESKVLLEGIYDRFFEDEFKAYDERVNVMYGLEIVHKADLEGQRDMNVLREFKDFRLRVSGGRKSSMGAIGMSSVHGFIDEIILMNNMLTDRAGSYRNEFDDLVYDDIIKELKKENFSDEIIECAKQYFCEMTGYEDEYNTNE
jgi:hypothetical protein